MGGGGVRRVRGRVLAQDFTGPGGSAGAYGSVIGLERCRVPFCPSSKQFECPCHTAIYKAAGEYVHGVPPRGMDRFPIRVVGGEVVVDTSRVVVGPPRGFHTMSLEPEGDRCTKTIFPEQS